MDCWTETWVVLLVGHDGAVDDVGELTGCDVGCHECANECWDSGCSGHMWWGDLLALHCSSGGVDWHWGLTGWCHDVHVYTVRRCSGYSTLTWTGTVVRVGGHRGALLLETGFERCMARLFGEGNDSGVVCGLEGEGE